MREIEAYAPAEAAIEERLFRSRVYINRPKGLSELIDIRDKNSLDFPKLMAKIEGVPTSFMKSEFPARREDLVEIIRQIRKTEALFKEKGESSVKLGTSRYWGEDGVFWLDDVPNFNVSISERPSKNPRRLTMVRIEDEKFIGIQFGFSGDFQLTLLFPDPQVIGVDEVYNSGRTNIEKMTDEEADIIEHYLTRFLDAAQDPQS